MLRSSISTPKDVSGRAFCCFLNVGRGYRRNCVCSQWKTIDEIWTTVMKGDTNAGKLRNNHIRSVSWPIAVMLFEWSHSISVFVPCAASTQPGIHLIDHSEVKSRANPDLPCCVFSWEWMWWPSMSSQFAVNSFHRHFLYVSGLLCGKCRANPTVSQHNSFINLSLQECRSINKTEKS